MPSSADALRVLFLVSGFPSDVNPAHGTFHETSVRALRRLGCQVFVVAPVPWVPPLPSAWLPRRYRAYARLPHVENRNGVDVRRPRYLAMPRQNHAGIPHLTMRAALRPVIATLGNIDVVHGHFAYAHGLAAVGLGATLGVPSVVTLHGSDTNVFPTVNRRARRRFVRSVTGASAVTAVSSALAERAWEIAGRRPTVVPIGIDRSRFGSDDASLSEARDIRTGWLAGRSDDTRFVLFVGRYIATKGLLDLLAALDRLGSEPVVGVFAGSGPLAGALAGSDRTIDLGTLPNERIPAIMEAADAIVLPSHGEGLPTVLVEAGAVGLPIVATSVGGIPELLGTDRGWLIPPRSPELLAEAVRRAVLGERDRSSDMAQRMKRHVADHYDAAKNAGRLIELYRSVARGDASPSPQRSS